MSKLWPFASESKAKVYALEQEIKQLSEKMDDKDDMESQIQQMELKSYNESDSVPILGTFGVVDEYMDKAALQRLFCTETWFYIAVNTIAQDIASLPIKLEKRKVIQQSVTQFDGSQDKIKRETWVDASAEPEYKALSRPNNIQSAVEFWMLVAIDLLATGDAFIYVDKGNPEDDQLADNASRNRLEQALRRTSRSTIRGMYRLSSSLLQPIASMDDKKILDGYGMQTDAGYFTFKPEEIVHIKLPNPTDPFYGLAPIIAVMKKLLLDRYTDEHMLRFYKQGARLGGVIKAQKKLTKDQLIRLERIFESNFTGKRNHHKTLVLPEGMDYQTIEQNPGETALIEFTKANKEPILAAYKVPPIKVGLLDGATYANAQIQDKTYYQNTIKPFIAFIEQAINQAPAILNPLKELKFSFDLSGIESLKENETEKANVAKGMLDSGLSVNEVREKVWKLPPLDGGEMVPVIEKNKAPPAGNPFGMLSAEPGETKTEVPNVQNDTAALSDIKPTGITFEQRVGEIVSIALANGIDPALAVEQAIATALQEGFVPTKVEDKSVEVTETEKKWGRFSKVEVQSHLEKTTGTGIAPLIEASQKNIEAMFDRMEKFFLKKLNQKSFSLMKTKEGDDIDFISMDEIELFVDGEVQTYTKDQWAAMRKGYSSSLPSSPLTFPNKRAQAALEEIGTQHLKSITGTARDRVKRIITDAYKDQKPVGEIASLMRDEFAAMKAGKANMIARTETLTAVSVGQRTKVDEFKKQFPDQAKKMKKVWVSAQDERVRDSHQDLDGVAIGVDEKFDNNLLYPRDPSGEASEVINCRCSSIEYLEEDEDEIMSTLSDDGQAAEEIDEAEKSYKGGPGSGRKPGGGKPKEESNEGGPKTIKRDNLLNEGSDVAETLRESKETFDQLKEDFPDVAAAFASYTDTDFTNIKRFQNGELTKPSSALREKVEIMEENFNMLPKYDGPVTRDLMGVTDLSGFQEGASFETDSFSSFTAKSALNSDPTDSGQVANVRMVVDKNKAGRGIFGISIAPTEMEVLVPKGTKYKVTKTEKQKITDSDGNEQELHVVHLSEEDIKSSNDLSSIVNALLMEKLNSSSEKGGPGSGRRGEGGSKPSSSKPSHGVSQAENGQITLTKPKTPEEATAQLNEVGRLHQAEQERYRNDPTPQNAMRAQHATRQLQRAITSGRQIVAANKR